MTKREAEAEFRENWLPAIKERERQGSGRPDRTMRNEAFGVFIDGLQKDGRITAKQYQDWVPSPSLLGQKPKKPATKRAASKGRR